MKLKQKIDLYLNENQADDLYTVISDDNLQDYFDNGWEETRVEKSELFDDQYRLIALKKNGVISWFKIDTMKGDEVGELPMTFETIRLEVFNNKGKMVDMIEAEDLGNINIKKYIKEGGFIKIYELDPKKDW